MSNALRQQERSHPHLRTYTQYSGKMLIALVPRFLETSSASVGQQQLRTLQQLQTIQTFEFVNN